MRMEQVQVIVVIITIHDANESKYGCKESGGTTEEERKVINIFIEERLCRRIQLSESTVTRNIDTTSNCMSHAKSSNGRKDFSEMIDVRTTTSVREISRPRVREESSLLPGIARGICSLVSRRRRISWRICNRLMIICEVRIADGRRRSGHR